MCQGQTTRLILEAMTWLSHGKDVVIVAHPAAEAFRIAEEIESRAAAFGIPCAVSDDMKDKVRLSDAPIIMIRPFGWVPSEYAAWRLKPKVLVDHSAVHEKGAVRERSVREVRA